MEMLAPTTNAQPARSKKTRRRCSQCGAREHDRRNCPELAKAKAKPRARARTLDDGTGKRMSADALPADLLRELESLGALRRALGAAGFVQR